MILAHVKTYVNIELLVHKCTAYDVAYVNISLTYMKTYVNILYMFN